MQPNNKYLNCVLKHTEKFNSFWEFYLKHNLCLNQRRKGIFQVAEEWS